MEVELNRGPSRLPRPADVDDAAVPAALTTGRDSSHTRASQARVKIAAIKADKRIGERERTTQLAAVEQRGIRDSRHVQRGPRCRMPTVSS
jgi:hypothetical protein